MAKMSFDEYIARVDALVKQGYSVADATVIVKGYGSAPKGTGAQAPAKELVEFKKTDGSVVMVTQAQADAWGKFRDNPNRKSAQEFEQMKADWTSKREAYKPTQALVDAIKANRAAITRKVAVAQYGFVGTKDDLKALKDSICK